MTDATRKPRRRLRFSLRLLLLAMLLGAAFFGGWAVHDWKLRRELERAQRRADEAAILTPPSLTRLESEMLLEWIKQSSMPPPTQDESSDEAQP